MNFKFQDRKWLLKKSTAKNDSLRKSFYRSSEIYYGTIIQKLGIRKELKHMDTSDGIVFLEFIIPTQGLFGYRRNF